MIEPFVTHRRPLAKALGLQGTVVRIDHLGQIRAAIQARPADVVFLATVWRNSAADTIAALRDARSATAAKLVYLDSTDGTNTVYFGLLPHVDAFVKKQLLHPLDAYGREMIGGYVVGDYFARRGLDLHGYAFGSEIPRGYADRLVLGWNLGDSRRIHRIDRTMRWWPKLLRRKDIDVFCRVTMGDREDHHWYHEHRRLGVHAATQLADRYRVAASGGCDLNLHVKPRQYHAEMRRSRLVLSPFGWGEVCYRDFEALCYGSLLVKPSMSHLRTRPDIYIDHETYVPVAWDFSDAAEKCDYYLRHADESARVIANARRAWERYFAEGGFVGVLREILSKIGALPAPMRVLSPAASDPASTSLR